MNKTFKQLLEITEVKAALGRLEELDRFVEVTRAFSLKCNAHLKVLASLVNALVESEDWLELGETPLRLPAAARRAQAAGEAREVSRLLGPLREDFERIAKHVEGGRLTADYLKDLLEKLLQNLPRLGAVQHELRQERTVTRHEFLHCHAGCAPGCTREHHNVPVSPGPLHRSAAHFALGQRAQPRLSEPRARGSARSEAAGEALFALERQNREYARVIAEQREQIAALTRELGASFASLQRLREEMDGCRRAHSEFRKSFAGLAATETRLPSPGASLRASMRLMSHEDELQGSERLSPIRPPRLSGFAPFEPDAALDVLN